MTPDRTAILASAVGIARYHLEQGNVEEAKRALDAAAAKTHRLLHEELVASGIDPEEVDKYMGKLR